MKRLAVLLALLAACLPARGQDVPVPDGTSPAGEALSLQEAIAEAQRQSPTAQIARLDYEEATWEYAAFRAQYMPAFSLTGSVPGLERSINEITQDDGSVRYVPQSRLSSTARLQVQQVLPWTGGQVFVSSRLGRLDLYGDTEFSQWNAAPVVVGLDQPLFAFNPYKWQRRLEPVRLRLAQRRLDADMAMLAVDITNRFFDAYIAQMNVDIAQFNVAVNDTIYTLSQGRFEIGRIAENDLLQSELALLNAQSDLSEARITLDQARQDLKRAADLPSDAPVDLVPPTRLPVLDLDAQEAVARARRYRADFLQLDLQELEADRAIALARGQNGPSFSLNAQYGLNQQAERLDAVYQSPLNQQRLSVSFNLPLYRWGEGRANVEAAEAARRRTTYRTEQEREEMEQTVYFEALRLEQLHEQVGIAAKADTVASRRFEVARNRYTVGQIDITRLFDAQREKDAARRSYFQTLRQFWSSYYRLRQLTLYDFSADQPLTAPGRQ